jgi:hypothetical protein
MYKFILQKTERIIKKSLKGVKKSSLIAFMKVLIYNSEVYSILLVLYKNRKHSS